MNTWLNNFENLINYLDVRLKERLPGPQAHLKMEPASRKEFLNIAHPSPPRKSAVLILLFEDKGQIKTVFIKRNTYDGVHSGQIAFPGGRYEEYDKNLTDTALRETEEEIGVKKNSITTIGSLTEIYIPPSNFDVLPVIGYTKSLPALTPDPKEVSDVFSIALDQLISPESLNKSTIVLKNGKSIEIPCFQISKHTIWGATAMILSEFIEIVSPK